MVLILLTIIIGLIRTFQIVKIKDVAEFLDKFNQLLTGKSKYQFKPLIMEK